MQLVGGGWQETTKTTNSKSQMTEDYRLYNT